jgi:two-component system sensor histidine kinase RegB
VFAAPSVSATAEPPAINLWWLVLLRFFSLAGQLATILFVSAWMEVSLPLAPLLGLLTLGLLSNLAALARIRHTPLAATPLLGTLLVYDVLHLTGLLYLTGGPFNPFSFAYLVLIALATVVLTERQVWMLAALSAACSALLFLRHRPLILPGGHAEHMRTHLYGMWVAFLIAAGFIVYFMVRIRRALDARESALREAQQLAAHRDKLASLATLAAGAAHELATPLATIALVAGELARQHEASPELTRSDLALIQSEVQRCRAVLDQMAVDAGQSAGESMTPVAIETLLQQASSGLPASPGIQIVIEPDANGWFLLPARALSQALRGLLKNAQEASQPEQRVRLRASCDTDLRIEVEDQGCGIPSAVAARIGEPFFSTKAPGRGMGLGVFLCRTVVESLGGTLQVEALPDRGTRAIVRIPLDGPATSCRRGVRPGA